MAGSSGGHPHSIGHVMLFVGLKGDRKQLCVFARKPLFCSNSSSPRRRTHGCSSSLHVLCVFARKALFLWSDPGCGEGDLFSPVYSSPRPTPLLPSPPLVALHPSLLVRP